MQWLPRRKRLYQRRGIAVQFETTFEDIVVVLQLEAACTIISLEAVWQPMAILRLVAVVWRLVTVWRPMAVCRLMVVWAAQIDAALGFALKLPTLILARASRLRIGFQLHGQRTPVTWHLPSLSPEPADTQSVMR